ncbi:Holliday junction resolvase RuvX [Aurantimonas sp. VKM B-3413]|uniref:Holliday junction resolvase RuvX n=1 Tax=Aurantimonas sp. VKM B-3413 TaxID=2779401 RepID=UPI001E49221B|nr:Holliday junction resolvase RuvX [Aurantimonas sp. VKM B-3413]MCB8837092.1 Holliday junction resolvase RuvX [Aurantimonas sp. VKM B-3413]
MTALGIDDFVAAVPERATIAGLDLGTKTIGLAVSDLSQRFATPRTVIRRTKFTPDASALMAALERDGVVALVVGLPINMDGSEGPRAQATRAFARNYARLDPRPLLFWDERLSTVAAERGLLEADVSRRKRSERIDSAAAAFILQGALDRLTALRSH